MEERAKVDHMTAAAGEEQYELGAELLADAEKLQQVLAGSTFQDIFSRLKKHGYVALSHNHTWELTFIRMVALRCNF